MNPLSRQGGILSLQIRDLATLQASYMLFIKRGGLFVPTQKKYPMGEEVFLLLSLLDEPEQIPVSGRVVWMTPPGASGSRQAGIGVQFAEGSSALQDHIEKRLAGLLASERPTYTL